MAYYAYYQTQNPQWGQQQYATSGQSFIAPPMPTYQPQPSWTGYDYYNAHYGQGTYESDVGMFDYIWGRIKSLVGASSVGRSEARYWHRRVYGGLVDITSLLPNDLGAAAGYEAYRLFNYHRTIYQQPLMDDREREEEALAGLAIAEATKLWSYCQRPADKYGRREACEVAAATSERLFRRARRQEREGGYDYADDSRSYYGGEDGGYSSSDESESRRRRRRERRRRRSSVGIGYTPQIGAGGMAGGMAGGGAMVIPGQAAAAGYPVTYGGQQLVPASAAGVGYGAGVSPNMGGGLAMPGVNYAAAGGASPYMGAQQQLPMGYGGVQAGAYQPAYGAAGAGGGLAVPQVGRPRASSFGYPASPGYY